MSDAKFKTLVIRTLKELSEDLNSIKRSSQALAGVAQWIEHGLRTKGWPV